MSTPILQFGTSRFLQAHVDLFVNEDPDSGPITIVETTGSSGSRRRISAFNSMNSYPVIIQGIEKGHPVNKEMQVHSVQKGLSAVSNYKELQNIFVHEACYIISNTGDKGFDLLKTSDFPAKWQNYPELLCLLLKARFDITGLPLTIMPCELITDNGNQLKQIILDLAQKLPADNAFIDWLQDECLWINSLVDRIVSEPIDPIGAVTEPYALWAIENQADFTPPCQHPAIQIVDNLDIIARRKLYILNLGHTLLAEWWQKNHRPATETVAEILQEWEIQNWLDNIMRVEVLPCFTDAPETAVTYWETTLERFKNPFLRHKLSDIATNHANKIERRCHSLFIWQAERDFPHLQQLFPLEQSS